jgi:hypothetical protein
MKIVTAAAAFCFLMLASAAVRQTPSGLRRLAPAALAEKRSRAVADAPRAFDLQSLGDR